MEQPIFYLYIFSSIFMGIVIGISLATIFSMDKGYRQGQIDAFNGIFEYELEMNEDGETEWVEKTKIKDHENI